MEIITQLVIVLGVVLVSMVIHEIMHGLVAHWLGDDTAKDNGRLSLNPFKHLDPIMSIAVPMLLALTGGPIFGGAKPVPIDTRRLKWGPWGMALVAIAGPITNFLLAFIGFLIGHFTGIIYVNGLAGDIASQFILINLGFCVFNLLPIPPLDGSRVLYAMMPNAVREIMEKIEQFGIIIVFGLILIFGAAFSQLMIGAIGSILRFFMWTVGY